MDVSPLPSLGGRQPLWLDDLVLAEICRSASSPAHLARIAAICSPLKLAATRAARKRLHRLLERLEVALPSCAPEHSFPIVALMRWEAFEVSNVLWYRADELFISSVMGSSSRKYVKTWMDRSGHNLRATAVADKGAPLFNACAINGHGALEFSGSSVLQSQPFSKPLPQPITIMVVARARGDTTIVDSLGSSSGRFELCHGYPSPSMGSVGDPHVVITADGRGEDSPANLLRGATRGNGQWHVYTAIFNGPRSELYVDGRCEGSGKHVGSGDLDGLSMGCDHSGLFHLKGSIAELRLFHAHIDPVERSQAEAALALRYGLSHASVTRA